MRRILNFALASLLALPLPAEQPDKHRPGVHIVIPPPPAPHRKAAPRPAPVPQHAAQYPVDPFRGAQYRHVNHPANEWAYWYWYANPAPYWPSYAPATQAISPLVDLRYVREHYAPEQVFTPAQLDKWATDRGYTRPATEN